MRSVILAAGRGSRLRPLTDDLPKCLLRVGGRPILARTISILVDLGIRRFIVVDGFQGHQVRRALLAEFPAGDFTFVGNPAWSSTNNAYSLHLARYDDPEDMLLVDSDLVFEPSVASYLLGALPPNRLAVRTHGPLGLEEMKVTIDEHGRVSSIGKDLPAATAGGESVGMAIFSADAKDKLFAILEKRCVREGLVDEWYEASFAELINHGECIDAIDLGHRACMEVDTPEDLELARLTFGSA